ncbi:Uncharacterized protein PBTT_06697 [Plasmodiophora brassicae]|uniref:Uncharacterized protein n=1 Tax=Plasmodiophora brassicae TaxID=37360 RepID=A0A0G4IVW2_PLABS|nr:hypothetical protein PBRA_001288 [Plasmodiophora brassicae]
MSTSMDATLAEAVAYEQRARKRRRTCASERNLDHIPVSLTEFRKSRSELKRHSSVSLPQFTALSILQGRVDS